MCLPLCHPQTLFGSLLIIPLLSEYSEARLLPWKNQLWKLQGGSHFWRLGESFKCLYKQCTGTGHRINTVPLGSGLLPMSVCKMQLPHCSLLRDGLKFVLPGANTGNVFLSISVELVIHCVFKECDNSAPCFDFFFVSGCCLQQQWVQVCQVPTCCFCGSFSTLSLAGIKLQKVLQVGKSHLPQKKLVLITADVKTGGSWSVWSIMHKK